jgi:hypothetical protein
MKHLHILKRVKLKVTRDVFMCADPECTWSRRKEFLVGKKFRCPFCNGEYIATLDSLKLKLPHCRDCTARKQVTLFDPLVSKVVDGIVESLPLSEVTNATSKSTEA